MSKVLFTVTVLLTIVAAFAGITVKDKLQQPLAFPAENIVVPAGVGVSWLSSKLVELGVLDEPYTFQLLAYWRGEQEAMKTGEYQFEDGMRVGDVLDQVVSGSVVQRSVTLVEGLTSAQILARLSRSEDMKITLSNESLDSIMSLLGTPDVHLEGQFFPDTYFYTRETSDIEILRQAHDRLQDFLQQAWEERDAELPFGNPYEALIMASIVEKETGQAEERPMIAGVFINRLRKGMKLQTDPTVIYGLGEEFNGNLRSRHLAEDTPYNTYTRYGIPPTPIALAGAEAIMAVMHPAETSAHYFVAKGDGTHQFSDTLKDHNNAVIKYQLGGRSKNFSSNPE